MNKFLNHIVFVFVSVLTLTSCHHVDEWDQDYEGNFDALWTVVDEHYCFFEEKGIDWNDVYDRYRPRVNPKMRGLDFFNLCAEMLDELQDGHVNLSSSFKTSYYRKWWSPTTCM